MTSLQPDRCTPYQNDLRWRMIHQYEILELPATQIAKNLNVDPSTVQRTVQRFREKGNVDPIVNSGQHKLTDIDKFCILELVMDKPELYVTCMISCMFI